ncbi:hypothetical protein [Winogradskyella aurantia]|uniref:Uncharacterized protein n=1 Tax=Winogradskyella aurantia TaxID=1915063 RepID=A0A265UZY6_9FLAO|nr:hypothetical protein [Winogradskyella aurantia]OZV70856.1 hypothetical protein CA834_01705 [Winogradskyella aurantia]
MDTRSCHKCGSNKIIPEVKIVDYGHMNQMRDLSIHIKTTDNIFFNKFEKGQLQANICGSCGNVELSVHNPYQLWEAYLKHKSL